MQSVAFGFDLCILSSAASRIQSGIHSGMAVPNVAQREVFNRTVHGARGLFAGVVLLYHVVNSGLPTWPLLQFGPVEFVLRTTEYGVELFFCISGFVIVGTLRRARHPAAFMADRLIRIYPVLWATVLVIVGLALISGERGFDAIPATTLTGRLLVNLLGLPGILPLPIFHPAAWTLSYELAFYGICAMAWALRGRLGLWASIVVVASLGGSMIVFYPRGIFFLSGVSVALGVARLRPVAILARYPVLFLVTFLLLWRLIDDLSLPQFIIDTNLFELAGDRRGPLVILAFIAATIGFAGIAAESGVSGKVLRSAPMQFMGTISYSFYLWHPIIMSMIKQAMLRSGAVELAGPSSQLLFFALSWPPSLLIGWLSQRVLERGVGTWLRHRLHHRASLVQQNLAQQGPAYARSPVADGMLKVAPRSLQAAAATPNMRPDADPVG
jgi:peptidoglycan/LPS O-acetylase OafA/YrhL